MVLKKELRRLCKIYNIKYRIDSNKKCGGTYSLSKKTIYISKYYQQTDSEILSTFFHELGHHYCTLNKIFKIYHSYGKFKNKNEIRSYLRTALRAEIWVDKWGEKEFKKWYPDLKYNKSFRTKLDKQWFYNYLQPIRNKL